MAKIKGFMGIRPEIELASKIAALPYDVMNSDEARKMVVGNKYSFLHVDKAEIDLDEEVDIHDKKVYEKARDNLNEMIDKKYLKQDETNCLYIYRQIMDGRTQTGLVFCASIDDYLNNVIKKHEFTREDKERDRINHVDYCNANTGPIFLTYREDEIISAVVNAWSNREPEYDFYAKDGIRHLAWVIDNPIIVREIVQLFNGVKDMYIADGHHRAASAVKIGQMRRETNTNYTGDEEFNYFLAVAFPDKELKIMDYNRVIKDLNGLSKYKFLEEVSKKFYIEKCENTFGFKPTEKHTFGMCIKGEWYKISARKGSFNKKNPIERLDVSILQENILKPILGIEDVRKSNRIDFIGGIRGIEEINKRIENDMEIAFTMYPTEIGEIMEVADMGEVMPPKSTWFEPKLRSGLFIHQL